MQIRWLGLIPTLLISACAADAGGGTDAGRRDARSSDGAHSAVDSGPQVCVDVDMDGIADNLERAPQSSVIGDDDGDGFSNLVEGNADYPGYSMSLPALMCGMPNDCDSDGIFNFRDTDSDNDGLTDAEERTHGTNPCAADTDGDGYDDLTEVAAGTNPTDANSHPPDSALYVTLPYHMPPDATGHVHKQFTFQTRIRQADVFFLVDNSGSMSPLVGVLRSTFSSQIIPGIQAAIPDIRIGVGSFDSVPDGIDGDPGSPGDYTLWVRQRVDANVALSQTALNNMQTIDATSGAAFVGGDYPEDQIEAIFESVAGSGQTGHESDEAARASVHNGLDPAGDGFVPRLDPVRDCGATPDDPTPFGWACFRPGRVPIIVLASDSAWWNGSPSPYGSTSGEPNIHSQANVSNAMRMAGAFFIGVDDGSIGDTRTNSNWLAMASGTLDSSGNPIAFGPGPVSSVAGSIVTAITTIVGQVRQDITTQTTGDPMEMRLMSPHTTADFVKAVTPDHGIPEPPSGYDRKDAATFYNVAPTTQVVFDVDFFNDFQPQGSTAMLFQATIHVLGRARAEVDHRPVYMIVPAAGAQPPG